MRVFAGLLVLGAAGLAACSGNFGSGSVPPTGASPIGAAATMTPTPTSASAILTYGESVAYQTIPEVGGYAAAVAFPKMPPPTAKPGASSAPSAEPVSIGATLFTVKPDDGPELNFAGGKGKKMRTREHPARALAYIKLLPTHDATLSAYPRISVDIPREIAAQYRDGEFGLALWNSGEKDSTYHLGVAERDLASAPPIARPVLAASPSPAGSASPGPSASPSKPPSPMPAVSATLPPQRLVFAASERPLKLVANRPAVFALYALPHAGASPSPSATGSPRAGASSEAHASSLPSSAASASPPAGGTASPSPQPTKT